MYVHVSGCLCRSLGVGEQYEASMCNVSGHRYACVCESVCVIVCFHHRGDVLLPVPIYTFFQTHGDRAEAWMYLLTNDNTGMIEETENKLDRSRGIVQGSVCVCVCIRQVIIQ